MKSLRTTTIVIKIQRPLLFRVLVGKRRPKRNTQNQQNLILINLYHFVQKKVNENLIPKINKVLTIKQFFKFNLFQDNSDSIITKGLVPMLLITLSTCALIWIYLTWKSVASPQVQLVSLMKLLKVIILTKALTFA